MSLKNRFFVLFFILLGMTLACTAPALSVTPTLPPPPASVASPSALPAASAAPVTPSLAAAAGTSATATSVPATATPAVLETPTPVTFPTITFDRDTNCRLGPARNYFTQTSFLQNRVTIAEGRNTDASWLWVQSLTPKTRCWVSVVNLKNPESYTYLPVIDLPPLPGTPNQIYVYRKDCEGRNKIVLRWPNVTGETGFHIYRGGIMLGSLKTDAVEFVDYPPDGREYLYEVESVNDFGLSVRVAVTVAGCNH